MTFVEACDSLNDALAQAGDAFERRFQVTASIGMTDGAILYWRRGLIISERSIELPVEKASLARRAEAVRYLPALWSECIGKQEGVTLDLTNAAERCLAFVREHS